MDNFTKVSYNNYQNEYIPYILDHFDKRDIRLNHNSRFMIYKKVIEDLTHSFNTNKYKNVIDKHGMELILAALKETIETYEIFTQFQDNHETKYISILKQISSGVSVANRKEVTTTARDVLFELNIAAHLHNAGFSTILDEPDVLIEYEGKNYHFACKRPNSKKGLENTIKKARRQIVKHGHGIICLSLDKLLNYNANVLPIEMNENLMIKFRKVVKSFYDDWNIKIQCWAKNRKVFGIIYHLSCMSDYKNEGIFTACQYFFITNACHRDCHLFDFIVKLNNKLRPLLNRN